MFGGSKRDEWGPHGSLVVSESEKIYNEIQKAISDRSPTEFKTVEALTPKFEQIEKLRFSYSAQWADIAREDSKSGGSYTLLFASAHLISQCAKALWVCYALQEKDSDSDIAQRGFKVFTSLHDNAFGNSTQVSRYGYKMSQRDAANWLSDAFPLITSTELWDDISKSAQKVFRQMPPPQFFQIPK